MQDQNDILFNQTSFDIVAVIKAMVSAIDTSGGSGAAIDGFLAFLGTLWALFVVISLILAFLFFVGYIYASMRVNQLYDFQGEELKAQEKLYQEIHGDRSGDTSRMEEMLAHIETDNPNDWKLAIIEADIELERVLEEAGYPGATIGEKLKSASPESMQTLQDAWEAHKVRNRIAHDGADFVLTKKVARETINQYRRVFAEFGVG